MKVRLMVYEKNEVNMNNRLVKLHKRVNVWIDLHDVKYVVACSYGRNILVYDRNNDCIARASFIDDDERKEIAQEIVDMINATRHNTTHPYR